MTSLCALRDDSRTLPHFEIVAVEPLLGALNSLLIVIAGHLFRRSCDLIVVSQHVDSIFRHIALPVSGGSVNTGPNDFAAEIHDRMPVFLSEQQFAPWLSGEVGAGILKPAPNDYLQRWPVSKRVNSSKADADDATLVERVELVAA